MAYSDETSTIKAKKVKIGEEGRAKILTPSQPPIAGPGIEKG
jgi:hypothetical protein